MIYSRFTRPRVLILCPFRGTAKAIIDKLIHLMGPNTSVAGEIRFGLSNLNDRM